MSVVSFFQSLELDLILVAYTTFIVCVTFLITNFILDIRFKHYATKMSGHNHLSNVYGKRPTKSNKIYVAGSWMQRVHLQDKMDELRNQGYIITSNWPTFETKLDNPDDYAECSRLDIDGVVNADTVLAFMTDSTYPYRGTFTEIGCAIGSGRRIILVCDGQCNKKPQSQSPTKQNQDLRMSDNFEFTFTHGCMSNVFFWDPKIEHVASFEDALKLLRGEKVDSPFKHCYSGKLSNVLMKNSRTIVNGIRKGSVPITMSSSNELMINESDLILTK